MNIVKLLNYAFKNRETYIVGGAIRDFLLKRPIKDIDLITAMPYSQIQNIVQKLASFLNSHYFALDKERGIWRISIKNNLTIDISPIEKDIKSDLNKRDFTINSMAISIKNIGKINIQNNNFLIKGIKTKNILNFKNGMKDLKKKTIKINSPTTFNADPLRMLRAFRFSSSLEFNIHKDTLQKIKKNQKLIKNSAAERIKEELMQILSDRQSWKQFEKMKKTNILFSIFPELKLQEKCAEVYYGKGGVLKHTFNVLKRMELILLFPQKFIVKSKSLDLEEKHKKLLKLSALLHDIAKPHKAKIVNGRLRFFEHEEYGAQIAANLMHKLRFSSDEIKFVSKIISSHLRVGNLAHNEKITDRAIFRLFSDLGIYFIPLLLLSLADYASYISETTLIKKAKILKQAPFKIPHRGLPITGPKKTIRFIQVTNFLMKYYLNRKKLFNKKNLITGYDVMDTLKIKEGPQVGYVLKRVKILQFEGKLKTKKQALNYIKTLKLPASL